ncbi:MAG: response regulator transcription factor [Sphingobacteriia bacterium]|nr:response regulator transcription factor [Sphingobacteriia bacterium]
MSILPICYFPTTVVLIDDNKKFLDRLYTALSPDKAYIIYNDSLQAMNYFENQYSPNNCSNRFIEEIEGERYQNRALNFNIYDIPKEVYNKDRFSQISCIVIDYDMPGLNGLELCASIKDHNIKKILLTGAADEHLAVEAFNNGLINNFIRKSEENLLEKVNKAITKAQFEYFTNIATNVTNLVINSNNTAINDPIFIDMFNILIREYKIIEYYIFEEYGCYLMVDARGKFYGLFIYPEEEIQSMLEEAEELNNINSDIVALLKNRTKIFCYHKDIKNLTFPNISERLNYLRPAKRLEGQHKTYYYSFTDDIMDFDVNKIFSFNDFISKNL